MSLFLLTAVPLAALAAHRLFFPKRRAFEDPWLWIRGAVWSVISLVLVAWVGGWRQFGGDLTSSFFGLTVTDVILAPGGVVAAWFLTGRRDPWELALWMSMVFTIEGVRDFVSSSRVYDLNEYFLVPLDRIVVLLVVPDLVLRAIRAVDAKSRGLWIAAASGAGLTGSLFQVLSFAEMGWLVWIAVLAGGTAAVWWKLQGEPAANH